MCVLGASVVTNAHTPIVLQNAKLIDGLTDTPIEAAAVTIQHGRVTSITYGLPPPADNAIVINLAGRYLLPGLIDAHDHLSDLNGARALVAAGVTTVRALGGRHYIDVGVRELHRRGMKDLPDVVAAGYAISPNMGEAFLLDFPELLHVAKDKVSGADRVRKLVQANARRGVNQIKILATERAMAANSDADPRRQTFTEPEIAAIVAEARKAGLPVAAHAHGDEGAAAAVRSGVRTIEHGWLLSDATLDLMKKRETCLVPTIGMAGPVPRMPWFQNASPDFKRRAVTLFASAHETATRARRKGVRMAAGTDHNPSIPEMRLPDEVSELLTIGMTPIDAIKAATSQAARCIGIDSRTGSIQPGLEADLLVVDGDPITDITALQRVLLVINDGHVVLQQHPQLKVAS